MFSRIALLHAESGIKLGDVGQRADDAEFGGRMHVAAHLIRHGFGAFVDHPGQRVSRKIPLVRVEARDDPAFSVLRGF